MRDLTFQLKSTPARALGSVCPPATTTSALFPVRRSSTAVQDPQKATQSLQEGQHRHFLSKMWFSARLCTFPRTSERLPDTSQSPPKPQIFPGGALATAGACQNPSSRSVGDRTGKRRLQPNFKSHRRRPEHRISKAKSSVAPQIFPCGAVATAGAQITHLRCSGEATDRGVR